MRRVLFREQIMFFTAAPLAVILGAIALLVNFRAERFVTETIAADFQQGRRSLLSADGERLAYLRVTAQLLTTYPSLKNVLQANHEPTTVDFLQQFQQQDQRIHLLILLDPYGQVLARTDAPRSEPVAQAEKQWIQPALNNLFALGILTTKKGAYHAAMVPAATEGRVFCFVLAGASVDDNYAKQLKAITKDEVVIAGDRLLGSTIPAQALPWKTQTEWERNAGGGPSPGTVSLAGESYAALPVPLAGGEEPKVVAVVLRSRDQALEPYRSIQRGLVAVGLVGLLLGIGFSAGMAQKLTAAIRKLVQGTERVAAGNFDTPLDIRRSDEIGDLGQAFNSMMRGLRERADMQKFVSQSTVEMIQANLRGDRAGERRLMTIFFSDIRGFTTLARDRAPEEVVRILNACLSLQAECVKKFEGDVDKFVGDSVVALFSGEHSAFQAIRCAREIVKELDAYKSAHPNEETVQVGIGIVTGEVILGSIGSEDRRDFTVVGSNVNLCARLCSLAKPGEILLAESSYQRVKDLVAAERLDPQQVKGFPEPIPVYRIQVQ